MSLEKMFSAVEGLRQVASADSVLGQPKEVAGRTLIPIAAVGYGFGLGFGEDVSQDNAVDDQPAGGGGGGGTSSRPLAILEVTAERTIVRPVLDETKVAFAGIALIGWIAFWIGATIRSVFGAHS